MIRSITFVFFMCALALRGDVVSVSTFLALELKREGEPKLAAVEMRRLGMMEELPVAEQAGFFWASAFLYKQAGIYEIADSMLNEVENRMPSWTDHPLMLRAEIAGARGRTRESSFYWDSLLRGANDESQDVLARRRLAAIRLAERDLDGARHLLSGSPINEDERIAYLDTFEAGRDKNPRVGGLLGMIPGMGYAYAGEYANAFRSLLLNSLFIFGMVDTARNNHWGGFAVITFFEITWYSGSIYGGIDASHRYNKRRMQVALDGIAGESGFEPDWEQIPGIQLRYRF